MKSKVIIAIACTCLLAVGMAATVIDSVEILHDRSIQHEEERWLEDLPEEDRQAAASTAIDPETFASHLPVISVETGGVEIPGAPSYDESGHVISDENGVAVPTLAADGQEFITAEAKVYDSDSSANRLSDDPTLESLCHIRVRGNSSRSFSKHNYQMTLVDDAGVDNEQELLGMSASATWTLHGPAIDKTLLRNYLVYNVAGQFMDEFVPEVRFFELFVDGEYCGVYLAVEPIEVEEGRMELNKSDRNDVATSYIVAIDEKSASETTISNFLHYTLRIGQYMDIVYPTKSSLTQEQKDYIEQDISAFEKALFSYDYDTSDYGYWRYIDVDSFVDTFVLNEFVVNDDYAAYSTYLYKDARGKIVSGPPWDFDNVFDNYREETAVDKFYTIERAWNYMLFKDEEFCERTINRYRELRQTVLSEEYLDDFIDETIDYLGPAVERNWQAWGSLLDGDESAFLLPDERNVRSYDEAVSQLKDFIHERGQWLDDYIENLRQYSHESAVKKFNH